MNAITPQEPQAPAPETAAKSPQQRPSFAYPFIPVRVVDARSPFPLLDTIYLNSIPRPGDLITVNLSGRRASYRVDFVNFEPYDQAHITLGCLPSQLATVGQIDPAKVNEFIQSQEQSFQKLEAYSKTIIALGYAGLFAIWGFVKDHLSHRAVLATAMLAGLSLIVYIGWEVGSMIHRTTIQLRFNRAIKDNPADQARAINDFLEQTRAGAVRGGRIWIVTQVFTVIPGFLAALILIYNVFAELTGLLPLP